MYVHTFLIVLATAIFTPLFVVSIHYGISYNLLERFVDPSFELKLKRLAELIVSYFIFSILILVFLDLIAEHFHFDGQIAVSPLRSLIPAFIFFIIRCMVRFHSARIGREHLNTIIFLIIVSTTITIGYHAVMRMPFDELSFPVSTFGVILLGSFLVPLFGDSILLFAVDKISFVRKFIVKSNKLIDLTEELPITLDFICGRGKIDAKITDIIRENSDDLCIMTNTYGTVANNALDIRERRRTGKIKIIGSNVKELSADKDVQARMGVISRENIKICECNFDGIRLIIDANRRLMLTFATAGYEGSHIGIYSEHPFVVSLFKGYFDTKCNSLSCDNRCSQK